jgi:hypothetical protein
MPDDGTTTGGTNTGGTGNDEGGEGRIDPKTGKPIIVMAYAVTGASGVYIADTLLSWAASM